MRTVLINNNDSFTHILAHLIARTTGAAPRIIPYQDDLQFCLHTADRIIISPGPGHPDEYPAYGPLLDSGRPVIGICLGMQIIVRHFGGSVSRLAGCVHGQKSLVTLGGKLMSVGRYHSLYCDTVPEPLIVTSATQEGIPMAVIHPDLPVVGFQFHPESFLTSEPEYCMEYAYSANRYLLPFE